MLYFDAMPPQDFYDFSSSFFPPISEIGGKALSLLKGHQQGLPVPPGFILPVAFFSEWFTQLKSTREWVEFNSATDDAALNEKCRALKALALRYSLTDRQKAILEDALRTFQSDALFAVRSSSPEEDLEGSSFAGGYETILGVKFDTMESAILRAFASCLDFRVVIYKREHGFTAADPKIAVVVMEQIKSEVSGVGFSLNPVNNDYDEAVFNSNWGLGETIVAGLVTPDEFVVDKITRRVKQKSIGLKEFSIWLCSDGGTREEHNHRSDELTLSVEQLEELTALIVKVEELYGRPIDIEWAFAGGQLFLLQARPITTWIPLPPDMVTVPGQPRRLYVDMTICVQGIYEPLSVMGTSFFRYTVSKVYKQLFGLDLTSDTSSALAIIESGRMYVNCSNILMIAGKEKFLEVFRNLDPLAASTIEQLDTQSYKGNPSVKSVPLRVVWCMPEIVAHLLAAEFMPEHAHRKAQEKITDYRLALDKLASQRLSLMEFVARSTDLMLDLILTNLLPLILASRLSLQKLKTEFGGGDEADLKKLELAFPHNVTTEMGLALDSVARLLPFNLTRKELTERIQNGSLSPQFYSAWSAFLQSYGHRGAKEIDIASPRYRDNHDFLVDLLVPLRQADEQEGLQQKFDRNQLERHQAFERLTESQHIKGWMHNSEVRWLYRVVEMLAGYRETPKFNVVYLIDLIRNRVLLEAEKLVQSGRLQSREQVFDLTLEELDRGITDSALNLIALAKTNRMFPDRLRAVRTLPAIIDSRGRILRPPRGAAVEGVFTGTPISAGIARGPVKSMHSPDEKTFEKGDILVARATDPGWTPLFVNASAVVLEVGGVLQHGALVAREYGLPCVAGISGVTELWEDGTIIEVNGSSGTVTFIE